MYILDTRVDFNISKKEAIQKIDSEVLSKETFGKYICTTNPEFIIHAQKDREFKDIINNSYLSLPDGIGVVMAKNYLNKVSKYDKSAMLPLHSIYEGVRVGLDTKSSSERITGVSLTEDLCELASAKGYSVFFLGGWPKDKFGKDLKGDFNIAEETAIQLKKKYPTLNIIGSTSSYSSRDVENSVAYIKKCMNEKGVDHIDILFVAYSFFDQHKWINACASKIPAKLSIGVGGTFNYLSGRERLTSNSLMSRNLDWFYRFITQPWRIRRTLTATIKFPFQVFLSSIK